MEQFKFILQNDLENILLYLSNGLFVFSFAIILIVNLIYKNSQKRICEMRGYSLLIFSTVFITVNAEGYCLYIYDFVYNGII